MKKITIEFHESFSMTIDMHAIAPILQRDGKAPFGTIDVSRLRPELEQFRINAGTVIYAAGSIENTMESVISSHIFGIHYGENDGRNFFTNHILHSSGMQYSQKKSLTTMIFRERKLLPNKEVELLDSLLRKVMDYRNAFAHGDTIVDATAGVQLSYYQGSPRVDVLTDEYLTRLETAFNEAHRLLEAGKSVLSAQCVEKYKKEAERQSALRRTGMPGRSEQTPGTSAPSADAASPPTDA